MPRRDDGSRVTGGCVGGLLGVPLAARGRADDPELLCATGDPRGCGLGSSDERGRAAHEQSTIHEKRERIWLMSSPCQSRLQ
eukprot:SAG25_NODE_438_length_8018_cov_7.819800_7_plen_82_part_00